MFAFLKSKTQKHQLLQWLDKQYPNAAKAVNLSNEECDELLDSCADCPTKVFSFFEGLNRCLALAYEVPLDITLLKGLIRNYPK